MNFYRHPEHYTKLRQLYWTLRSRRAYDLAKRQWCYRHIRAERRRLENSGHDSEHIRLYCRWMANPALYKSELNLLAYEKSVAFSSSVLSLIRQNSQLAIPKTLAEAL